MTQGTPHPSRPPQTHPGSTPFEDRAGFDAAILSVIRSARATLLLVDRDFSDWPIESVEGDAALHAALRAGVHLRLLVRDPAWLARHGARFARLRRVWSDRIACRQWPETMRIAESLAVADRRHAVIRKPPDRMHGVLLREMSGEAIAASDRPTAAWEESEPCLPATTLGL